MTTEIINKTAKTMDAVTELGLMLQERAQDELDYKFIESFVVDINNHIALMSELVE